MEHEFRFTIFLVLVGLACWAAATVWSAQYACYAYHGTPDVSDFRAYVWPHGSGESKIAFLFQIPIIVIAAPAIVALPSARLLDRFLGDSEAHQRHVRFLIISVFSLLLSLVAYGRDEEALTAASRHGWHGQSQPNEVVDRLCWAVNRI